MAEVVVVNKLKPLIDRIERLHEESRTTAEMIKEVYAEAKNEGFDVAAMKRVVTERRKDPKKIEDFEETVQLYRDAVS
tara:strand:- start:1751 stop:1984 length:234 start_codon:yes stop_codon:yes gene_type:complete